MLLLPKNPPIRDRAYLDHLRDLPCIVTQLTPCEPAHLRLLGSGGMSMKPGDNRAVSLYWELHRRQSKMGEGAAWLYFANEYKGFLSSLLIEVAEQRYENWKSKQCLR